MGPKKIKRSLYEGKGIPENAADEHIREAMLDLTKTLLEKLNTPYTWLAVCSVAVSAGYWGGDRRKKSREKLLGLINMCREHLDMPVWNLEHGWSRHNLIYGYGALNQMMDKTGKSVETLIFEDMRQQILAYKQRTLKRRS